MNEEIKMVVARLRQGDVILYPTDAGWCVGCDAANENAVKRVLDLKALKGGDRTVLIDSTAKLQAYVSDVPDLAYDLMDMSEKPLTLVLPHAKNLDNNLLDAEGYVRVRITRELFSKRVCEMFRRPVVAISATNKDITTCLAFDMVSTDILEGVDYVVQYGQNILVEHTLPSIVKLGPGGLIKVIRE